MANQLRLRYGSRVTEAISFLNPLNSLPGLRAGWVERVPNLPLEVDRDEAMRLLKPHHESSILPHLTDPTDWWRAEQVHGNSVAKAPGAPRIAAADGASVVPAVDGLITNQPGIVLSIYVADCGPIWLADKKTGAIGLLHSGKKGTEGDILGVALTAMKREYGTVAEDVTVILGPCIRPPDYEIDFAAEIGRQAIRTGVQDYHDCGLNTASDLERNYSYRKELGKTGRMMAWMVRNTAL